MENFMIAQGEVWFFKSAFVQESSACDWIQCCYSFGLNTESVGHQRRHRWAVSLRPSPVTEGQSWAAPSLQVCLKVACVRIVCRHIYFPFNCGIVPKESSLEEMIFQTQSPDRPKEVVFFSLFLVLLLFWILFSAQHRLIWN